MAGIYIHIPFCKTKCAYCDFYSVVNTKNIEEYVNSICIEIEQRNKYLQNESIDSIYFGGGTPSLLSFIYINQIINTIFNLFSINKNCEITLEANPDDITSKYIQSLRQTLINRISLGIQSFNNDELILLNRRHDSEQAIKAVELLKENSYNNISIDLIYGIPNSDLNKWQNSLNIASSLNIQHVSAYHLTYEKGTPIFESVNNKTLLQLDEALSISQFKLLIKHLENQYFIHYEISNFAKDDSFSIHNSNYWKQKKYLGIGASAHSYDLNSRQWNISNIDKYIEGVTKNKSYSEIETLSVNDKYNDYILTSLRTKWGGNLQYIRDTFGEKYALHFETESERYINSNLLNNTESNFNLTKKGIFISDRIMSSLFYI